MNYIGIGALTATVLALAGCQASPPARIEARTAPNCPAPGSAVTLARALNLTSVGSRRYLASEFADEQGLCVTSVGDRRLTWNLAGRIAAPAVRAEHAALQAQITPLAVGKRAQTYVNLPEAVGLRSMQYQVTLSVLRDERIGVPAGEFDTFVVEDRERNLNCIGIWQAWVDKKTFLPVRLHYETSNCLPPGQSDLVANRVIVPRS